MASTAYRDYSLSPAHRELRAAIAQFADDHIRPLARAIDQEERYPLEVLKGLAEAGFTRAAFPKSLGGSEVDSLSWSLIIAEVARASGSAGLALGVSGTASLPILRMGTPEQKRALLPVMGGKTPGVYAQTEPEQGSDVARLRTIATPTVRDSVSGWEITGHKVFISNAWLGPDRRAQWAVVLAQTGEVGNRRTMRFFLVPLDTPGIEVQKISTNGMRGSGTSDLFFDQAFVPEDALLGKDEAGFQAAMQVLGASRIFFSARGLGIAEGALDHAQAVLERVLRSSPQDPRLEQARRHFQQIEVEAFHLRALVYRASRLRDAGEPFDHQVAILKWVTGDTTVRIASAAYSFIAAHGGSPDELADANRFERDAGQIPLAEGTSEIMERIIARDLAASLRSDEGPTIAKLLQKPGGLQEAISEVQDPAQATDLLFILAKAAYREAVHQAEGEQPTYLFPEEAYTEDESEGIPRSPIPSPRQEPLGAERSLAALEVATFEAGTFLDALAELPQEALDFPAREEARHFLASKVGAALAHAQATFDSLGDSYHWLLVGSLESPEEGSLLVQMAQRAMAWGFKAPSTARGKPAKPRGQRVAPPPVAGGSGPGNSAELERFRQEPRELAAVEVNPEVVKLFAQVSGDHNPYHLDPEFARKSRYQGQIGHGILTVVLALSEVSRELPSYMPLEVEVRRFTAPVRFGDRVRATILETQPDRDRWRLEFVVTNQDDVGVLEGNLWLRPRTPADGPSSWLQTLGHPLEELRDEALEWSKDVPPFPVREAPKFTVGESAEYSSVVSQERLKANIALTKDSPWLTLIFAMEAVAQASAELAPGFILVGMETGDFRRPFQVGESLHARATLTRQGTLAHRPLDRIRIEIQVVDAEGEVVCTGAVYKESEAPVEPTSPPAPGPYPGVEMVVPVTPRMLDAFARLHLPPFLTILDLGESVAPGDKAAARDLVVERLRQVLQARPDLSQASYLFLRPNHLRSRWAAGDLLKVVGEVGDLLDGVLLPRAEGPGDVLLMDRVLTALEQAHGWEVGRLKIEVVVQNPRVVLHGEALVGASARVVGLIYAPPPNLDTSELRLAVVQAMQNAGIDAVDGVTTPLDDGRRTALDALRAATMGFQRKWALNPVQLNAVLNPQLYLSKRNVELGGIPTAWVQKVLAYDPQRPFFWGTARITKSPRPTDLEPFSLVELEQRAAREEPLA